MNLRVFYKKRVFSVLSCVVFFCSGTSSFAQQSAHQADMRFVFDKVRMENPGLMAAREELEGTKELYPQARAGWLPSVNGEAGIFTSDIESDNPNPGDGATTKEFALSIDQPVWRGGRTTAEIDRAQKLIRAGEALLSSREQDLFYEAARSYINVLRDRELLDLRRKNSDILMQELEAAQERRQMGATTITDVEQAEARLARAQALQIRAEGDLSISEAGFEEIVGMAAPSNLADPAAFRLDMPADVGAMEAMAENNNPSLIMLRYEREAAGHNADAIFRELLPQLSAYASVNKQYDPQPGLVSDTRSAVLGLRATIALYQGGATRSRIRQARSEERRQAYEVEDLTRDVKAQVLINLRAYQSAVGQRENRAFEIEAARKALDGVREEMNLGQRTLLDVLDSDRDLIEAEVAHAYAQADESTARFALARTLGVLHAGMQKNVGIAPIAAPQAYADGAVSTNRP